MTAFRAIVRNVVRAAFRNRTAMIFTLGLAVFFMVIFGLVFSGGGPSLRIGVVDLDHGALAQRYTAALQATEGLTVETGGLTDERDRLQNDKILLLAVIEPGFDASASSGGADVQILRNADDAQNANVAYNVVFSVTNGFARTNHLGGGTGINLDQRSVSTNDITRMDFILPAMIAYIVLQSGINFVAIGIVDQRQRKVLRRFLVTPLRPVQVLGGNIVGGAVTVLLQVLLLVAVGVLVFHAKTHGSWLLAALLIVVGTAAFVSIGFLLTSMVRTSESARGLATMVAFPMLFLSGVFIPLDTLPQLLQDIVHALPLTYLTEALHAVLNDGNGLTGRIAVDIAVLAAWALGCFTLAAWRFRWE